MAHEGITKALKRFVDASDDDYVSFFEGLKKESDRGSIILVVTAIEDALSEAIKRRFVALSASEEKALYSFNSPLGTFSSRIQIAHALGVINGEGRAQLNLMRAMRNACAHARADISFETPQLRDAGIAATFMDDGAMGQDPATLTALQLREVFTVCAWILSQVIKFGENWDKSSLSNPSPFLKYMLSRVPGLLKPR